MYVLATAACIGAELNASFLAVRLEILRRIEKHWSHPV